MRPEFRTHTLTEDGKAKAAKIAMAFDSLLAELETIVPTGRPLSLVKTKLEEACFYAKKGMAEANAEPENG